MVTPRGRCTTLANQRTEPAPANVGQPRKHITCAPVITEIDDERAALHRARVDETPIAWIRGIVAVIAQHEILVHRDPKRPPRIARGMIAAPLLVGAPHQILALPVELGI